MSDVFATTAPRMIAIRPLTKGMFSNISSLGLPDGSFRKLVGYDVRENGPRRCDPFSRFIPAPLPFWESDEICDFVESFSGNDKKQITVAITNRALYRIEYAESLTYYSPVYWKREYTVNAYTTGTGWLTVKSDSPVADLVKVGDFVRLPSDTGVQKHAILEISGTGVRIETGLTPVPATDSKFKILKEFAVIEPFVVDYTIFARSDRAAMILVDGSTGGIFYYDGDYLDSFPLHDQNDVPSYDSARTVAHYNGRLYFGGVGKAPYFQYNRVIWGEILDMQEVNALSYQDLTGTSGQALKLTALGSMIFMYFTDGLYYGRQTNLAGLPYAFTLMDTGGISAVGMRAMAPFLDGQVFVGRDDVYYVNSSSGLEPIGSPIMLDTVHNASERALNRVQIQVDSARNRVVIGFGVDGVYFDIFALFNYRTKAWSLLNVNGVSSVSVVSFYDDLDCDDVGLAQCDSIGWVDRMIASVNNSAMLSQFTVVDSQGDIHILSPGDQQHTYAGGPVPVSCCIESGDFDFDVPNTDKTVFHVGIKVNSLQESPKAAPILFRAEVSNDRGATWKQVGNLWIPVHKTEGAVDFRITGSTFRYRLTSASPVEAYEINENTLKVGVRGVEPSRAGTNSNP